MAKMIGIEIGSDTLKMVVCSGGVVKKVAIARMPEDLVMEGRMTSTSAMVEFLKTTMKANRISGGACALVIPSQHIITHRSFFLRITPSIWSVKGSRSFLSLTFPFEML